METVSETASCKRELQVEVPAERVQSAMETIARNIQKKARIPGFRPGKTPISLIRQRFSAEIRDELLQQLVPDSFLEKAKEANHKPVASPAIEDVHLQDGEPLKFKAVFEVFPEIELGAYRGIEMEYREAEVSGEEVETALGRMRERAATFEPEEARALAAGDFAQISFAGTAAAGKGAPVEVDDSLLEIGGKNTVKEFTENLRGKDPGQTAEFDIAYPEDYHEKRMAGCTYHYLVKINAVKRKVLPELNDDFARDTGEFQTLDELREDLRLRMISQRKAGYHAAAMDKLLAKLVDMHNFPVPEVFVERRIEQRLERMAHGLREEGIDLSKIQIDWRRLGAQHREPAIRDVKASMILSRIAEQEGFRVPDEEMNREIEHLAEHSKLNDEVFTARFKRDEEAMDRLRNRLLTAKTETFLVENATKVAWVETSAAAAEEPGVE